MGFYSFSLLLFLLGETCGLYVREASPRDQAAQCSETTETLFWQRITTPDPAITNDVALEIPTTVTRTCRDRSLLKRQPPPSNSRGRNVFNAVCHREITGQRLTETHTLDLEIDLDGRSTVVLTPDGGRVEISAEQESNYYNLPPDNRQREELQITIINRSTCPVWIEWISRLRIYPEHSFMEGPRLEPRGLEPTPRHEWETEPNECYLASLMPIQDVLTVAIRLLIVTIGRRCNR